MKNINSGTIQCLGVFDIDLATGNYTVKADALQKKTELYYLEHTTQCCCLWLCKIVNYHPEHLCFHWKKKKKVWNCGYCRILRLLDPCCILELMPEPVGELRVMGLSGGAPDRALLSPCLHRHRSCDSHAVSSGCRCCKIRPCQSSVRHGGVKSSDGHWSQGGVWAAAAPVQAAHLQWGAGTGCNPAVSMNEELNSCTPVSGHSGCWGGCSLNFKWTQGTSWDL